MCVIEPTVFPSKFIVVEVGLPTVIILLGTSSCIKSVAIGSSLASPAKTNFSVKGICPPR